MIHLSGVKTNPDSKSLIWLSGVTEWSLVSSAWVCPDWSGSESQQCPTREAPPLAANTDFYTVTWAVRAHDTAYFAFSHSHAHTHVHTLMAGGATWFICSKAECKTVQNLCDQVRHKQKSLLFPWVVRNDSNWTNFFWNADNKWNVQSGKERKNLTELKAVNVQLRGRILTNHMVLPAVAATGSSCRCRSLRGAAWLFPAGNAQVSRKPHRRGCRGRRPAAKESRLESEGPAEEKIDARLNHVTKPNKQTNKQKNKTTICFGLFICAWH